MGTVYSNTSTTFHLYNFDRISIVSLKDRPDLIKESAKRFSSMFNIDIKEYLKSMDEMLTSSTYPLWLVALFDSSHIIGGLGVIENDFHSRKDLSPNISAVFTLSAYRGVRISQLLINKAIEMMHQVNIDTLYVITNHIGLYEKYGFEYLCDTECGDETSRLLIHKYKK